MVPKDASFEKCRPLHHLGSHQLQTLNLLTDSLAYVLVGVINRTVVYVIANGS